MVDTALDPRPGALTPGGHRRERACCEPSSHPRIRGRPLIQRYGRYIFLTSERVERATGFLDRHGGWIIIIARFIEGLRQANGIIAGISGMHWAKFLAFNAIGATLWVTVWTSIAYLSGSHINTIYNDATRYSTYVAAAVMALLVAYLARHMVRARRAWARTAT